MTRAEPALKPGADRTLQGTDEAAGGSRTAEPPPRSHAPKFQLTVEPQLLEEIKREFREIRDGVPGRRFLDHYHRSRSREGGRATFWTTFGYVAAGLALVICGFVLSLPPGVPGFLLWIPGLALLAARSKGLARLLDRLEAWGRQAWQRYVTRR